MRSRRLPLRTIALSWLLGVLVLLTPLAQVLPYPLAPASALAAGTPCTTSGPANGAYSIQLCLTAPLDGATLRGEVPVSGSVTTVSGTSPGVNNVSFYLTKQTTSGRIQALTDFLAPFSFRLPTARWVDGAYKLEMLARMEDGSLTTGPLIFVTLANGVTVAPSSQNSWQPKTPAGSPLVVAAVGDGAGGLPGAAAVGDLIGTWTPDMLLYLGDVYNAGSYAEFTNYYEPTLGRFKDRTNPVPGNHETGKQWQGYFDYWDTTRHFYSYNAGGWHVINLDSTTQYNQTAPGTAQYEWLVNDLQANTADCTIVAMHHPRYGLTSSNGNAYLQDVWSLLTQHGVDLVLTGHEHNYQRWQPLNGSGALDPLGPTQFVVGTGGHELMTFGTSDSRVAKRVSFRDGALRLTLGSTGASFAFVDTAGNDRGTGIAAL